MKVCIDKFSYSFPRTELNPQIIMIFVSYSLETNFSTILV